MLGGVSIAERAQDVDGRHDLFEHPPQRPRNSHFLDDDTAGVAQVDDPRDRRANLAVVGRVPLVGNSVDPDPIAARVALVVNRGDHIAVGRETLPEARAEDDVVGPLRAQQDLRGPECARGEYHVAGHQAERPALPRAQARIGVDDVEQPSVGPIGDAPPLEAQHRRSSVDAGASLLGRAEQIHVERVLRAVVASSRAVATAFAFVERDVGRADTVRRKRDGDRRGLEMIAVRRHPLQHPELGRHLVRIEQDVIANRCAEHLAHLREAFVPVSLRLGTDLLRPLGALEDVIAGLGHHARVDERAATETVRHDGADIGAGAHVEESLALPARGARSLGTEADVAGEIGKSRRKHPRQILAAALEHANADRVATLPLPVRSAGEACRGDRAAVAAADDDHIEVDLLRRRLRIPRGDELLETAGEPRGRRGALVVRVVAGAHGRAIATGSPASAIACESAATATGLCRSAIPASSASRRRSGAVSPERRIAGTSG